ncbi:MAG: hypothetical protein ACJAWV_000788 [Flammeovirgaceae bacterium]|jgi:hypothetical protein
MNKVKASIILPFLLLTILSSCNINLDERVGGNFNGKEWKSDPFGCQSKRVDMLESIKKATENLKRMGDADVRRLFGRPDKTELFSRSQKFYLYYIEEGKQCEEEDTTTGRGRILEISLDALGRLHEINIRV